MYFLLYIKIYYIYIYICIYIYIYIIYITEYTEELYKKDLNDPDNYDGMITHLEPDILECSQVGLRKHHHEQS